MTAAVKSSTVTAKKILFIFTDFVVLKFEQRH
jgi:hypothetical protein